MFVFLGMNFIKNQERQWVFLLAGLLSYFVLMLVFSIYPKFSGSDAWYFMYSLSIVLLVFACFSFFDRMPTISYVGFDARFAPWYGVALIFIALSFFMPKETFGIYNFNLMRPLKTFNTKPFKNLSRIAHLELRNGLFFSNRFTVDNSRFKAGPINHLKSDIVDLMSLHSLRRSEVLLFVPKEVYEVEVGRLFKGIPWAQGMLMTAVTGLPLVHGLQLHRAGYGFADYSENAYWRPRNELATGNACSFGKTIIVVEQLSPPKLSLHPCPQP
jgi:hypothetical protein